MQTVASSLVECATHAIIGANIGPYRASEWEICKALLPCLTAGMLCLADRGFNGYSHWQEARQTGAALLWRCAGNRQLPVVKVLGDGSYLSVIYPGATARRKNEGAIQLRVIEYELPRPDGGATRYRLLTSLLDAATAPALELATLYRERWQIGAVFDELKTHPQQKRRALRSKTAGLVRQEFYGWVLAHYAVRWLMHQVAGEHQLLHAQLSFTAHVRLLRRTRPLSGAFSPGAAKMSVHRPGRCG